MRRLGNPIYEPDEDFDLGEEVLENFSVGKKDNKPKDNYALDFDDDLGKVPTKLPVIGIRTSAKSNLEIKKPQSLKKKDQPSYDFFQQDLDEPIKVPKKQVEESKDQYADDFEQDDYQQDFDDFEEEQKPQPNKDNSPITKIISQTVKVTKQTSRKIDRDTLSSRKGFKRPSSMNKNRLSNSNNKYQDEIQTSFPNTDLKTLDNQKLLRLNERIRNMIRRLNDQLNDILNKNAIALKLNQKSKTKNIQQKIQVLSQQRNNNLKMIERMESEINRLKYRQGQIREDDYELQIHRRIDQLNDRKKQLQKTVVRLKLEVDNQGKKLYDAHHRKDNQIYGSVKAQLVHLKKGEQGIINYLGTLDNKIEDMDNKNKEADEKLKNLISQAEEKGIDLSENSPLKEKSEKLKTKQESSRKAVAASQGIMKVRADRIVQEILLITRNIEQSDMEIRNLYSDIEHSMEQSRKLIQKNRQQYKNNSQFISSLTNIEKSLIKPILTDFHQFKIKRTSRSASSMHRSRVIQKNKKQSQGDILPLNPISLSKVTPKESRIEEKPATKREDERIWKDDSINQADQKKPDEPHPKIQLKVEKQQPTEKPQPQDDTKPKFMLKRRANQESVQKVQQPPVHEVPKIEPSTVTSNDDTNKPFSIGRFKAKKKQPQPINILDDLRKQSTDTKNEFMSVGRKEAQEEAKKQATTVPVETKEQVVAPRRFMMMRKRGQQDATNEGYNPSIGKTDTPKEQRQPINNPQTNITQTNPYAPTNNPSNPPPSNPPTSNPYAPSNNPYAPKPQRQGRLKKAKVEIPKEKFSIFDAKQVQQVNEFMTNTRKQEEPKEQLDINAMLGISKPRQSDPQDELIFGKPQKKPLRNRLQMPY